ncbi:MAG: MauE/DoxX family redox-associated membrane protein [Actinomycetota bacterium]|nr:MauE/DoxX family redox-associated membrane protein [Actinomycetota bacterium]
MTGDPTLVATIAAFVLAAVLAASAGAKLADRPATAQAFASLGVPAPGPAALAVPVVELAVAVTLVAAPAAGGFAALAVLVCFTLFLVDRIRSGTTAPCRCFGGLRTEAVGRIDIVRNVVLMVLALVALLGG